VARWLAGGATVLISAGLVGVPVSYAETTNSSAALVADPTQYVDPMIGTGMGGANVGEINNFPGPSTPFGMLQFSPDTQGAYAGYQYNSNKLRGFSLTHASVGCRQFGDVPILPTVGSIGAAPWDRTETFSHDTEQADPGYYAVTLADSQVRTELTSATRTGLTQMTFPATDQAQVLVKAGASLNGNSDASLRTVSDHEVVGSATTGNFCGKGNHYTVYFSLTFDRPFTAAGGWDGTTVGAPGKTVDVHGAHSGGFLTFDTRTDRTLHAKVAISYVSVDGAQQNMRSEIPGWDLNPVRAATRQQWKDALSRIQVGGGTTSQLRTFYAALYHSLQYPTTFSDVDARYIGFDDTIHSLQNGQSAQYANFSLWDTYRSLAPLQGLLYPHIGSDLAQSLVNDAVQGGWLPKWPVANHESGVMDGDNATPFLSSLYAFGARQFDTASALKYMLKGATVPSEPGAAYQERQGVADYQRLGYVPNDKAEFGHVSLGASQTLEYSIDDFTISKFADSLGQRDTANTFAQRAQNWQNVFDPGTGYPRPKDSQGAFPAGPGFVAPAAGQFGQDGFDEGNAAQYNFLMPQNMAGLINSMGGRDAVNKRADSFFQQLNAGPNAPNQWSGNEIDFAAPWLYNYTGQPWKTQDVVRRIETELFADTPNGEPGNDDLGAQSAWYVWAALGMYPSTPGTTDLALNSPLFPKAAIHLPNGRTISIEAPAASANNRYVTGLALNGKDWNSTSLPSWAVTQGASLTFALSSTPNTSWGTGRDAAPPSYPQGQAPAIGFTTPTGQVVTQPGTTFTASVGAVATRSPASGEPVSWQAQPAQGITVTPTSGKLKLGADGRAEQPVQITVASWLRSGYYPVPVTFHTQDGTPLPGGTIMVAVPDPDHTATTCDQLGQTDTECGLRRLNAGDGVTTPVTVGGRAARSTTSGSPYMYFDVANSVVPGGKYHAVIQIDYYDHGTGSWSVQYDSSDPAQKYKSTPPVARTNTDTWKTATFTVDDAGFTGRENGSADFRLSSNGGDGTISRVHVAVSGDNVLAIHLCPTDQ
jgi:predicted alpha-1,2-mannosidase